MSTITLGRRQRRWPAIALAVVVALFLLFTLLTGFAVDVLWYREVGQSSVLWTTVWTRVGLGLVSAVVFAGLLYANLLIARRLRPTTRILTPDQEVLERIRELSDPFLRWLMPVAAVVLGLLVGVGVSQEWQTFLVWRNSGGVAFGNPEPLFGRDPAFYIFSLPWLKFLQGWLFSSLVGVVILTALAHVLWGGIRPQAPAFSDKVTPAARAHLSVLLGLMMIVKAWGYWLGRFDLLTSPRGVVDGASYTDVKAQLPALNTLAIVAVICALLFFANIRVRQWSLPVIAVGLLALVSVLLGTAYPAFIQQFRVKPNEQELEIPYIEDNIAATQDAFALTDVEAQRRDVSGPITANQVLENETTVSNIRLWRGVPALLENMQSFQRGRQYYDFSDVDVDRYLIDGERRVLMVSPREIHQDGITTAGRTWQNLHLTYTHGFGATAVPVNTATSEGQPVFLLGDLPPVGEPEMDQPRIYYGESDDVPFVVVGTNVDELDYDGAPENVPYQGEGGISIGSLLTRAVFAWNFRDYNLLVSGALTDESRILINRDIQTRVPKAVPFLGFDDDPYFALVEGQPIWIWDAYTYTNEYPYSQSINVDEATGGLLGGSVNYLRNPVKAVVDAYDGSVTYYADTQEPIVQVWDRAFPGLFTPIADAPADLAAHFRYPENLFQIQAAQYANYHVVDPQAFYQKRDFWQIPTDPTLQGVAATGGDLPGSAMRPYYQLIRLPGEEREEFQLVIPFVPEGRPNMVAWMAASSDPASYGQTTVYRFPEGRNIEGPGQVFARINQDQRFAEQRTLLDQAGSSVTFGDFLIIPIDDSFLYVQPVFVRAAQESAIPELTFVAIVNGSGGDVRFAPGLQEARALAVEGIEPPDGGDGDGGGERPPGGEGTLPERIAELLVQAEGHFAAAEAALRDGDLAEYQVQIALAQQAVSEAVTLAGRADEQAAESSATPSASPSP
jgi:uncharacterized membrane protein (UPF0182 family)